MGLKLILRGLVLILLAMPVAVRAGSRVDSLPDPLKAARAALEAIAQGSFERFLAVYAGPAISPAAFEELVDEVELQKARLRAPVLASRRVPVSGRNGLITFDVLEQKQSIQAELGKMGYIKGNLDPWDWFRIHPAWRACFDSRACLETLSAALSPEASYFKRWAPRVDNARIVVGSRLISPLVDKSVQWVTYRRLTLELAIQIFPQSLEQYAAEHGSELTVRETVFWDELSPAAEIQRILGGTLNPRLYRANVLGSERWLETSFNLLYGAFINRQFVKPPSISDGATQQRAHTNPRERARKMKKALDAMATPAYFCKEFETFFASKQCLDRLHYNLAKFAKLSTNEVSGGWYLHLGHLMRLYAVDLARRHYPKRLEQVVAENPGVEFVTEAQLRALIKKSERPNDSDLLPKGSVELELVADAFRPVSTLSGVGSTYQVSGYWQRQHAGTGSLERYGMLSMQVACSGPGYQKSCRVMAVESLYALSQRLTQAVRDTASPDPAQSQQGYATLRGAFEAGISLEVADRRGFTPLLEVARTCNRPLLDWLKAQGHAQIFSDTAFWVDPQGSQDWEQVTLGAVAQDCPESLF